ncbi:hypothetical protein FRC03_007663 [Tulasnella sp. 419]|nr:hypothetical protein FRC03_007663 [Tulasnella sp. 419]
MVLSGFLDFERSQQPFVTPPRLPTPAGVTFEFHSTVNDTAPSTIPYSSSPISYSPILQSPVTTASPESVTTPEADWDWPFLSPEGLAALVDEDLLFPPQTPTI